MESGKRKLKIIITLLGLLSLLTGQGLFAQKGDKVQVNIRITEAETGKITPAMVCIMAVEDKTVLLPPDGRKMESVSNTKLFERGIEFNNDKNWIGPVRKMNGMGDNDDRSFVYGMLPSLPYWDAPVAYLTSGDFGIQLSPGTYVKKALPLILKDTTSSPYPVRNFQFP